MPDAPEPTPPGSRVALYVLLALVVLSPWPFGSVHLRTTQAIALISLATALAAFLWDGWHGLLFLPPRSILWPLLGLWALAAFQLIPLPAALHHWLAPASAFVWHPAEPAAAAVLGPGPHPISIHPDATRRWLAFATGVVTLALAAAPALRHRALMRRAAIAIVASGLAVALYGLIARVALGNKLYGVFEVPTVAPFGPFVSKNHFAGYVELTALLAVGLAVGLADEAPRRSGWFSWIDTPAAPRIVAAWGAAVVLILAVPVSLSRGGVLSLAAGLAAFALLRLATRRSRPSTTRTALGATALLVLTIATLALVLPETAQNRMRTLPDATTEQSGSYRLLVWRSTLGLMGASPLVGTGFGAYEDALPRFKLGAGHLRVQHAENDYLELLSEGGLVAGLLLATLVILVSGLGLRSVAGEHRGVPRSLRTAAAAGLVALCVHALFDFNLRIPSNALCAAALAALLLGPSCSRRTIPTRAHPSPRLLLFASAVLVTLAMATITPWSTAGAEGRTWPANTGPPPLRRHAIETRLRKALHERPGNGPAWVQLAWVRLATSRAEALALADRGRGLDPLNPGLRDAASTIKSR